MQRTKLASVPLSPRENGAAFCKRNAERDTEGQPGDRVVWDSQWHWNRVTLFLLFIAQFPDTAYTDRKPLLSLHCVLSE